MIFAKIKKLFNNIINVENNNAGNNNSGAIIQGNKAPVSVGDVTELSNFAKHRQLVDELIVQPGYKFITIRHPITEGRLATKLTGDLRALGIRVNVIPVLNADGGINKAVTPDFNDVYPKGHSEYSEFSIFVRDLIS